MPAFALHAGNPHYFDFRDRPTVLVTSAEHYGLVLNADFDADLYLQTLAAAGLNHSRVFTGAYCEQVGAFKIDLNTLAPAAGRLLCPWARSDQAGFAGGGNRFDLDRWDDAYFTRLRHIVDTASRLGIVLEITLFCPFYRDDMWDVSPMKASNNVNGVGDYPSDEAFASSGDNDLWPVQEAMVRRIVEQLRDADNIYYEVMNEPYQRNVPMAWQALIVEVLRDAESDAPAHLISLNIENRHADASALPEGPIPAGVSLLNFHYAWPPVTVAMNYGMDVPIGDNETGFAGQADVTYRREGWAFLLSGGALYNHLDYSFAVGHEGGDFAYPKTQPGGGSAALRVSLGALARFMEQIDFVHTAPLAPGRIEGVPEDCSVFGLEETGRQLALYLCRTKDETDPIAVMLTFAVEPGSYRVVWVHPVDGSILAEATVEHGGGGMELLTPVFTEDVALQMRVAP